MSLEPSYCPSCGTSLTTRRVEGRDRRYCTACEQVVYRNPKPCAGVAVVDDGAVLLVRRTEPPSVGAWSLPAGYLEVDETPRAAAVRELREETKLAAPAGSLSLLATVTRALPDGRSVLVVVYALPRYETSGQPVAGSDAGAVRFWDVEALDADAAETIEPGYRDVLRRASEYGGCE